VRKYIIIGLMSIIIILFGILLFRNIFNPGLLTEADNPVHLVEAEYMKSTLIPEYNWINGWYPNVFMGIPIQLYSHQLGIWLVVLLSYTGLSMVASYKIIILLSFILPALLLFYLLKKKFGLIAAFIPAFFFLFQREYNHLLLAGMWNSGIGLIFLLLELYYLDKYKDPSPKAIAVISLLQSLAILSHLFIGLSGFILILAATLLNIFKNKKSLLWLLCIPLSLLTITFYIIPFIETKSWINESFGWGLGNTFIEMMYKLIGIFLSLKQNTFFLNSLFDSDFGLALIEFFKGILINLPTIIIDVLGILGIYYYIKLRNHEKFKNFLDIVLLFLVFMLIIGSGFWFLFAIGNKIPFLKGIVSYKFVYYARISLYIFAAFYLSIIIKKVIKKDLIRNLIKYLLILSFLLMVIFNNLYLPGKEVPQTFPQAEIHDETIELWSWLKENLNETDSIIDPVTFNGQISSQSTILALTPLYTNSSILSTWVSSYYPIEKYLSSDNLRVFSIPRNNITSLEIKEKMLHFNSKYLLTIEPEMKNLLNKDPDFRLEKEFKTYSVYSIRNFKNSFVEGDNIDFNIIKKSEQELKISIINKNKNEVKLIIKIAYHPYWNGFIENKKIKLEKSNTELIQLNVPEGNNIITLEYDSKNKVGIIISIFFLITLLFLIIRNFE